MKTTKFPSPMKLLLSIVDDGMGEDIERFLNEKHLNGGLIFKGKGTAESDVADIFGFGLSDKDIIAVFIPNDKCSEVIDEINILTGVESHSYGLNLVLDLGSASSNLLDLVGISMEGISNGKESK